MLRHLRVTNFSILSDVSIDLVPGFNVLTGETGAGKSLIVEAVNLLRGGRASADIPRAGADQAVVEAIFENPSPEVARILEEAGLPIADGELLVRRVIHRGGRSRTYVNGALTTAARLSEIGGYLVDLSGQHQHQGLVDAKRHRQILDAFMQSDKHLEAMSEAYHAWRTIADELTSLTSNARERSDRLDYLQFQLSEIDSADPRENEDVELLAERNRLAAASRLEEAARRAEATIYSDDGAAVDRLAEALREMERVSQFDDELLPLVENLREAHTLVQDVGASLRAYADGVDGDPRNLAAAEERLAVLKSLFRKHGEDVSAVLRRAEELRSEIAALDVSDERVEQLSRDVAEAERVARAAASTLSTQRKKAATRLRRDVAEALQALGMASADLSVRQVSGDLSEFGADRIEFLLAANRGEEARPLAKVASGGELSRIMLAMKLILRRADDVGTYVFDEVDTGIGGETADVVASQIASVARATQVLCVTHLPQIAVYADRHFRVEKYTESGRTETAVSPLSDNDRREEIARMLGGVRQSARAHAKQMLASARG